MDKPIISDNFTIDDIHKYSDEVITHANVYINQQINGDYTKERTNNKSVMDIVNEIQNRKK